jgi:integrase
MPKVWIFQDPKQVAKHGKAKAAHYVGWYTPDGKRRSKSCGVGTIGKREAERLRDKRKSELTLGTYGEKNKVTWQEFRERYERDILPALALKTEKEAKAALTRFEEVAKPRLVAFITTGDVDRFAAKRRRQRGLRPGTTIAPETINKELRHLRAALRKAVKWGYLETLPAFDRRKGHKQEKTYVTPEDFAKLYAACDTMKYPKGLPYAAADWWRGLLVTAYLTGWRIGALLALRRADVDLDKATALSRAEDNKGKRDVRIPLHPLIVDHLRRQASFKRSMFPWHRDNRALYVEFARLQRASGVKPANREGRYGFHDLRRAFATMNVDNLSPEQLQAMMQHKAFSTTEGYIKRARELNPVLQKLFVPDLKPAEKAR